ncbi:MAG TPA: hypothetical protein VKE98_01380 [Gemmataceae bacterium]|nr:hypothetical protein [Gemmataceae bacterium]
MDGRKLALWIGLGIVLGNLPTFVQAQEPAQLNAPASLTNPGTAQPTGTSSLTENDVHKIVGDYLKTTQQRNPEDVGAALQPQSEERNRVGPDLQDNAKRDHGQWFINPSKDFIFRFGGWVQFDGGWWSIRR